MIIMRKILLLMTLLTLVFSITVNGENIAEFNYSSFKGASLLDFTLTADLTDNIVVKGTYSIADTIIGDADKFDIMSGYKVQGKSTLIFLVGMRKSEYDTGLLLSGDFRSPMLNKETPLFVQDVL